MLQVKRLFLTNQSAAPIFHNRVDMLCWHLFMASASVLRVISRYQLCQSSDWTCSSLPFSFPFIFKFFLNELSLQFVSSSNLNSHSAGIQSTKDNWKFSPTKRHISCQNVSPIDQSSKAVLTLLRRNRIRTAINWTHPLQDHFLSSLGFLTVYLIAPFPASFSLFLSF